MSNRIPKALQEVWSWKDKIYEETKHLDLKEYAKYIRRRSKEILKDNNYKVRSQKLIKVK